MEDLEKVMKSIKLIDDEIYRLERCYITDTVRYSGHQEQPDDEDFDPELDGYYVERWDEFHDFSTPEEAQAFIDRSISKLWRQCHWTVTARMKAYGIA